jgi:alpha-L-fucosidase
VGPKPDGELPIEQEERLREMALWHFAFGESIHEVRPWVVTNEGNVWFTRRKNTLYVFLTKTSWTLGERKSFTVRSVRATKASKLTLLGTTGEVLEYRPTADPHPRFTQDERGLHLDVMMAQRIHDDRKWPHPIVLKLTEVEPALQIPRVVSSGAARAGAGATLRGTLESLGDAAALEVGFEYRRKKAVEELLNKEAPWVATPLVKQTTPGPFTARIAGLATADYEFRAVAKHPLLTTYGEEKVIGP